MAVLDLAQDVQNAVEREAAGELGAHQQLLLAIHRLNLAVESPTETLLRTIYQVVPKSGATIPNSRESKNDLSLCASATTECCS